MTNRIMELAFQAEVENINVTMNETIPVLLVAGFVTTFLILAFILISITSVIPRRQKPTE